MKIDQRYSLLALCALSLVAMPAAFANQADKDFKSMDLDNDGSVTRMESASGARTMFAKMDADRDGIVTVAEMEASHAMKDHDSGQSKMTAAEMLKMCDTNGDGKISAAEHTASSEAMFAKMDTNGDNKLSKDECEAGHKNMKKHKDDTTSR